MSSSSRHGGGSRASDEDGKTSVKVGEFNTTHTWNATTAKNEEEALMLMNSVYPQLFVSDLHSSPPTRASSSSPNGSSGRW